MGCDSTQTVGVQCKERSARDGGSERSGVGTARRTNAATLAVCRVTYHMRYCVCAATDGPRPRGSLPAVHCHFSLLHSRVLLDAGQHLWPQLPHVALHRRRFNLAGYSDDESHSQRYSAASRPYALTKQSTAAAQHKGQVCVSGHVSECMSERVSVCACGRGSNSLLVSANGHESCLQSRCSLAFLRRQRCKNGTGTSAVSVQGYALTHASARVLR